MYRLNFYASHLNPIRLTVLALGVVHSQKALSQEQQALIDFHKEKRQFNALSIEQVRTLLRRIEGDLRLGKVGALEYELIKGLLEDRLAKLPPSNY